MSYLKDKSIIKMEDSFLKGKKLNIEKFSMIKSYFGKDYLPSCQRF